MRKKVVIYEEYCRILDGDPLSAALLWLLESRVVKGFVSISIRDIERDMLGLCTDKHIRNRLRVLEARGFIGRTLGPAAAAARYEFHPDIISAALDDKVGASDVVSGQKTAQRVRSKDRTESEIVSGQKTAHESQKTCSSKTESPSDSHDSCPVKRPHTNRSSVRSKDRTRIAKKADLIGDRVRSNDRTACSAVSGQTTAYSVIEKKSSENYSSSPTIESCAVKRPDRIVRSVRSNDRTEPSLAPARTPDRPRVDTLTDPVFQEFDKDDDNILCNSVIHRPYTGGIALDSPPPEHTAGVVVADREPGILSAGAGIDPHVQSTVPASVHPRDPSATASQITPADPRTSEDRARQSAAASYIVTDTHRDRTPAQISGELPIGDPGTRHFALQPSCDPIGNTNPSSPLIASPARNGERSGPSKPGGGSVILQQLSVIYEASGGLLAIHGYPLHPPIGKLECSPDEKTLHSLAMRILSTKPTEAELREIGRMIKEKSKFPFKGRSEHTYPLKMLVGDKIWGPLMLEVRSALKAKPPAPEKPAGPARPLHDGKYPYSDAEIRGAFMMGTLSREEWPELSKLFPPEQSAPPRKERQII